MANLGKVIYINEEDYSTLLSGGSITKGGTTYTYDSTALYVIKDVSAPEYAETAGYATNAGHATTASQDGSGNDIITTYSKKPLVIEVDDTDTSVPQGTYNNITAAIAAGRDVLVKVTITESDDQVEYMRIRTDYSEGNDEYKFENNWLNGSVYSNDTFEFEWSSAYNHSHGNITYNGTLQPTDITIANGDKLVITDASGSHRVTRASLTFDGSTTTQALSKKGTWETFKEKTFIDMTVSDTTPSFKDANNNSLTHAQVIALLADYTKDVEIRYGSGVFICTYNGSDGEYYFTYVDAESKLASSFMLQVDNSSLVFFHYDDVYLVTSAEKTTWDNKVSDVKVKVGTGAAVSIVDSNKVANVVLDTTPTANSTNTVTSGGIKTALDAKQDTPLVIEVNDTDTNVPYDTYNNITAAVTAGKDVWLKVTLTQSLNYKLYMRLSRDQNTPDHMYWFSATYSTTSYIASIAYTSDFFFSKTILALRDSPTFTGTPTAPTAAAGTNTTQIATTAFVQDAISGIDTGGSEMVDVTINGSTSSASFSTNPYNAIKAVVDDGKIAVLNASVAPISAAGVLIPIYEYTYSQSGTDYTGYKGSIQHGSYEISVDVQDTGSATVTITEVSATITVDTALSETSTNPVQNKAITAQILENEEIVATALNNLNDRVELKQDQLVSGTTIKTINNQSILGSGNITISGGSGGGGGEENVIETVKVNGTALTPDANKAVDVTVPQNVTYTLDLSDSSLWTEEHGHYTYTGVDATLFNNINTSYNLGYNITLNIKGVGDAFGSNLFLTGGVSDYLYGFSSFAIDTTDNISGKLALVTEDSLTVFDFKDISIPTALSGLTDDATHRLVTDTEKSTWNGKYSKPSGGIPKIDLSSAVQTSLGKADTALQPDVDNDLAQGTISSSNSQGFNYIIADKSTSSEQTLQDALDAKASTSTVNAKYTKPSTGIPKTDLASAVTTSLGKADSAVQDIQAKIGSGSAVSIVNSSTKIATITMDSTPTSNSTNTVTSGGVYTAINGKYTKPAAGIPDTDLTTAVNMRLLAQLSSSSDDGKIMKYSYSAGSWQAVKPVTIYSGSSAPSSSTGSNGDIYIQTS